MTEKEQETYEIIKKEGFLIYEKIRTLMAEEWDKAKGKGIPYPIFYAISLSVAANLVHAILTNQPHMYKDTRTAFNKILDSYKEEEEARQNEKTDR
jgi:hypothetical protein